MCLLICTPPHVRRLFLQEAKHLADAWKCIRAVVPLYQGVNLALHATALELCTASHRGSAPPMKPAENCEMGHDIGGSMGNAGDWDCSSQPLSTIAVSASDRQPPASLHQNHELQVRAAVHCSAQAPADSATFSDPDVTTRILRSRYVKR